MKQHGVIFGVVTLLLVASPSAFSQASAERGWEPLEVDGGTTRYAYKPKTLTAYEGNRAGVWVRRETPSASGESVEGGGPAAQRSETYDEFDCSGRKTRKKIGKLFSPGKPPKDVYEEPWEKIPAGSAESKVLDQVCREAGKKRAEGNAAKEVISPQRSPANPN
jgi:hypothetical protein